MNDNNFLGKIAFQGIAGAFSQQTCTKIFPKAETIPCFSFSDAFATVEAGRADYAIIPIENSRGGRVAEIHHILGETSLSIIGETFSSIRQHLLGIKGAKLPDIDRVLSHPQALAQCHNYLQKIQAQLIPHADTAGAAKEIAEIGKKHTAAIASRLAAKIHGLQIIAENIQDDARNTTRFLILSRNESANIPEIKHGENYITSIIFELKSQPAALYKALGGFAHRHINLLKIESYIALDHSNDARFYIELSGHSAEEHIKEAMNDLQKFIHKNRILGTYYADPWRKQ